MNGILSTHTSIHLLSHKILQKGKRVTNIAKRKEEKKKAFIVLHRCDKQSVPSVIETPPDGYRFERKYAASIDLLASDMRFDTESICPFVK